MDKLARLADYRDAPDFTETERLALEYADAMTFIDKDVDDELFARLREHFEPDQLVELTAIVSLENFLSKFHRAFRVESQGFCVIPR